jgi:hypothetical protein
LVNISDPFGENKKYNKYNNCKDNPPTKKPRPPTKKPTDEQGLKYKGANKAPTYDRLTRAWKAYNKNNKSGELDPSSSYADLVQQGYLQFKNGKWVRYLQPGLC